MRNLAFSFFKRISYRIVSSSTYQGTPIIGAVRCFHCLLGRAMCFHLQLKWFQYHWTCRPVQWITRDQKSVGFVWEEMWGKYFWDMTLTSKLMVENLIELSFAKPKYMNVKHIRLTYRLTWHDMVNDLSLWTIVGAITTRYHLAAHGARCLEWNAECSYHQVWGCWGWGSQEASDVSVFQCEFLMLDLLKVLWCFQEWKSEWSKVQWVLEVQLFVKLFLLLFYQLPSILCRCCHICLSSPLSLGSRFVIGQPIVDLV